MTMRDEWKIETPKPSQWRAILVGDKKGYGVEFRPQTGQEPNAFHRFMQRLCFGVRWVKD